MCNDTQVTQVAKMATIATKTPASSPRSSRSCAKRRPKSSCSRPRCQSWRPSSPLQRCDCTLLLVHIVILYLVPYVFELEFWCHTVGCVLLMLILICLFVCSLRRHAQEVAILEYQSKLKDENQSVVEQVQAAYDKGYEKAVETITRFQNLRSYGPPPSAVSAGSFSGSSL